MTSNFKSLCLIRKQGDNLRFKELEEVDEEVWFQKVCLNTREVDLLMMKDMRKDKHVEGYVKVDTLDRFV